MEKLKYSEKQIAEILASDLYSLIKESKDKLDSLEKLIEADQKNKGLKREFDVEYAKFLKLFCAASKISTMEH